MAAVAPFIYLGRTLAPVWISPLDPLPISPGLALVPLAVGCAGLAAVTLALWTARDRWPGLAVAWIAFALMLAPVVGLTPSGLQATADRYMYVAGVIVSLAIGLAVLRYWPSGRLAVAASFVAAAMVAVLDCVSTWIQTRLLARFDRAVGPRAADLDPRNDIATYNLAIALAEGGREEEAINRYEQTIRLVPDHALARQNLAIIQGRARGARRRPPGRGGPAERSKAIPTRAGRWTRKRVHAQVARIMLLGGGCFAEVRRFRASHFDADVKDTEVPNALAFALMQTEQFRQLVAVLETRSRNTPRT